MQAVQTNDILKAFSHKMASCCASISAQQRLHIKNMQGSALAFGIVANSSWHSTQIVITQSFEQAAYLQNELSAISPTLKSLLLPSSFEEEKIHYKLNKTNEVLRTETLLFLSKWASLPKIVIIPIEGLLEKIPAQDTLQQSIISLQTGDAIDLEMLTEQLVSKNFRWSDFVYEPGQISLRGGILDIFSFAYDKPYRIQLKGDTIQSIRIFDTETQISEKQLSRVQLSGNMNILDNDTLEKIHCLQLFDTNTPLWIDSFEVVKEKFLYFVEKNKTHADNKSYFEPDNIEDQSHIVYTTWQETEQYVLEFPTIETGKKTHFPIDTSLEFNQSLQPIFNRKFDLLLQNLKELQQQGYTLYLFYDNVVQYNRLLHILEDLGEAIVLSPIAFNLHQGFIDHQMKIVCYADHQIFNRYHKYSIKQIQDSEKQLSLKALKELQPGDYITHIDHGVGVFSGLQKIEMDGKIQEAIRILYKDNDILYVNIYSLHKISKYTGKDNTPPTVHKLGSDVWQKLKSKTKRKVKEIAFDLIKLYAQRKAQQGFAHYPDNYMQNELEASFLYEDTPDQSKAVADVKRDMELAAPMDRLVCGDVGFGKTEVAIRAAFKAVLSGKQVAVLVPTTILAFQHYQSFSRRLKNFPVTIEFINRFKTTKQKKEIYQQLQDGKIDIIIGTHALLSKDVVFKDLGLLVIDEEQKFGVSHKEKLKLLSTSVDTLTLTATPIPRTLQFSLMGARDLSIIQTPPANRKPIYTEVHLFDIEFIRDAILEEIQRNGQIYFIHNKVQELYSLKTLLQKACPEASIEIAHGQMEGSDLEKVVLDFMAHEYDVLMCTNIIESGIDVPNANTILVNNAHCFGLSDLHQLRGRVGRSNKKAYCYLLAPPYSILNNEARKRLQTLELHSDLGSGFQIAMQDLDIRGAGNLLGGEQSGFIQDIGIETYQKILEESIQELKHHEFKEVFKNEQQSFTPKDCSIETDFEILIPDEYITQISERLNIYTRLNKVKTAEDIQHIKAELEDRFGKIPIQVEALFTALQCKRKAMPLGIERIIVKNHIGRLYFTADNESLYFESDVFKNLLNYIQNKTNTIQLKPSPTQNYLQMKGVKDIHILEKELDKIGEM